MSALCTATSALLLIMAVETKVKFFIQQNAFVDVSANCWPFCLILNISNMTISDLDRVIEPLRATCTTKVKANSVKQEFEKQDELKRSALRAVDALLHIHDAGEVFRVDCRSGHGKLMGSGEIWAPSQYKDCLIYVWRFPC